MSNTFLSKNDEQLAILALTDTDAMEFLMKKYNNLVRARARAYYLIGGDKDDLIQEGMIGLYKAIRDFDINKVPNFSGFADLCVKRQIITAIKTATRLKHGPLNSYISFYKNLSDDNDLEIIDILKVDSQNNPEELIMGKEFVYELKKKMESSLSKFENHVLALYLQGLDYHEISEKVHKQAKSIDNALQRIKKKITKILDEDNESML